MKEPGELLKNLVPGTGYLKPTIKGGVAALKPHMKELEAIHIRLDYLAPSTWRKKKYYHIQKQEVCSQLDEWIYEHLVGQKEYAAYLERYRPARARGEIGDIDEYIMDTHYRPQAIKVLRRKKSFDLVKWTKNRIRLDYRRRSNLYWKSGDEFRFDYRNSVQSLFIRKNGEDKRVFGVGGSGSSGQRQMGTFFTAVFYLLGKKTRIPHFLLKHNGFNEFEYVGRRYRTVLTPSFGSNFSLDKDLEKEIWEKGIYWK